METPIKTHTSRQTVFITGVSDGIGRALATHYAAAGARVLGVGRRPFPASLAGAMQPADYCRTDLSQPQAAPIVSTFLDTRCVDRLNCLVHNAALGWFGSPATQSAASIVELLATNLVAPIALTHALLGHVSATHGVVAFVSSVHAALPASDFAVYAATKAALDGFARNLRIEERGNVSVIVVWPGATRTEMQAKSGVPAERIKAERYMAPEVAAAHIARAVQRRRSRGLGFPNQLARWLGVHFEQTVDRAFVMALRRGNR
jgi:short-subunit dehydrogenase